MGLIATRRRAIVRSASGIRSPMKMSSEVPRRSSTMGSFARSDGSGVASAMSPKTTPSSATRSRIADVCHISAGVFS